jgi:hypothetical protein
MPKTLTAGNGGAPPGTRKAPEAENPMDLLFHEMYNT